MKAYTSVLLIIVFVLFAGCAAQEKTEQVPQNKIINEAETKIEKCKEENKTETKPEIKIEKEQKAEPVEEDLTQTKGMGFCSSLQDCFVFCKSNVGRCNDFCNKNLSHELCEVPEAAKPKEWVTDAVTQPLPEGASSVRLILPAKLEDILYAQIGAYGAHPGGHAEGLDHEWISIKDNIPIRSWADGVVVYVNDLEGGSVDTPNIIIYYGDGLWGEHMHVQRSLVKPGDKVKAGDPVGYGEKFAHAPGYQFAEFNVADQHRRDGVVHWYKFIKGATLVSPFDYLQENEKKQFVEKYLKEVDPILSKGKDVSGVVPTPWEPYLTNPILFHKGHKGELIGEWYLKSEQWVIDETPDVLVFFTNNTKYYKKQRVVGVEDSGSVILSGDWEADYKNNKIVITTHDSVYYGIFNIDESGSRAKLKIEYQKDTYPNTFSEKARTYIERDKVSRAEERYNWSVE